MGITTALTPQWVVSSSSSCTNFWLLLPLSPSPPARLRPTPGISMEPTTPTPTGQERAPLESAPPAMAADPPTTTMARGAPMLRLMLATSMEAMDIPTTLEHILTATDTAWPELLPTPEPPPPSLPGAPRDSARGALTPSQDTSPTTLTPSPQCPTPLTAMDLLDIPLVRVTPELPPPSSL